MTWIIVAFAAGCILGSFTPWRWIHDRTLVARAYRSMFFIAVAALYVVMYPFMRLAGRNKRNSLFSTIRTAWHEGVVK